MALSILAGLVLLVLGGDSLVRGSVSIARRLGLSELLIGLVLVGFGTSTPELVTSIKAALAGSPGIAVGNVVGSNIANILLILGLTALIAGVPCSRQAILRDGSVMMAAAVLLPLCAWNGVLATWQGGVFLAALVGYVAYSYIKERQGMSESRTLHEKEAHLVAEAQYSLWLSLLFFVAGLALTIYGARLLVDGSVALAQSFGVSETIIGLTIVAVGTSLPEMVTSIIAAIKKSADVALGNIIGSNIYNIFSILGITALIIPVQIPEEIWNFDIWFMIAISALMLVFAFTSHRISRLEGGLLFAGYVGYTAYLISIA